MSMREFLLYDGQAFGEFKLRAHLMNHSTPQNLAERHITFEGIVELLYYLEKESHEMTFDDVLGTVKKVEIDLLQRLVVLKVMLKEEI